ncbi:unnamed protein product, partial [Symbiodinium microadriaticum]
VFRGYRSDSDLSVQQQFCDEVLIRTANDGWLRPSIVISVFVGWKVPVTSFEVGARVYSIGPRGSAVASDHATTKQLPAPNNFALVDGGIWQRALNFPIYGPHQLPDIGADVGEEAASFLMDDRDYFMKDLEQTNRILREVVTLRLLKLIPDISWHSCRVTLLSAVHAQQPDKEIGLEAKWRDPSQLVMEYARNCKEICIEMVRHLAKLISMDWSSPQDSTLVGFGDSVLTYVTKARAVEGPAKGLISLKYHAVYVDGSDTERTL